MTVAGTATLSALSVGFQSTVDGTGNLAVTTSGGDIAFAGAVGSTTRLGSLSVSTDSGPRHVAAALGREKRPGQVFIGFALESGDGRSRAAAKRAAKHLDGIVLNNTESMGAEAASFAFLDRDGRWQDWGRIGKTECARRLLAAAAEFLGPGAS